MANTKRLAVESDLNQHLENARKAAVLGIPHGISMRAFTRVWNTRFSPEVLDDLVIPHRTFMRRKQKREDLNAIETDKALRLARITLHADQVFHGRERADAWLGTPNSKFSGQTPFSLLKSEVGCRLVDETLYQIEHGIYT